MRAIGNVIVYLAVEHPKSSLVFMGSLLLKAVAYDYESLRFLSWPANFLVVLTTAKLLQDVFLEITTSTFGCQLKRNIRGLFLQEEVNDWADQSVPPPPN